MWINLFSERLRKNKFDKANALKRPVYGTFLPATINTWFLLYPINGVDCNGFMFQFRLLIQKKKNEA
jgi:hypothetical protein